MSDLFVCAQFPKYNGETYSGWARDHKPEDILLSDTDVIAALAPRGYKLEVETEKFVRGNFWNREVVVHEHRYLVSKNGKLKMPVGSKLRIMWSTKQTHTHLVFSPWFYVVDSGHTSWGVDHDLRDQMLYDLGIAEKSYELIAPVIKAGSPDYVEANSYENYAWIVETEMFLPEYVKALEKFVQDEHARIQAATATFNASTI